MASGDQLAVFLPAHNEPPAANYATPDFRNATFVLDFDDTTEEAAVFRGLLRRYAGGGITVTVHFAATAATSGTGGWTVAFEKQGTLASDGFAGAQTVTAVTVPGSAGDIVSASLAVADGAAIDSLADGDRFRLRLKRDVANDTAAGDLELVAVELVET